MNILAVTTSTDRISVCMTSDGMTIGQLSALCKRRHSEMIMPLIDELLRSADTVLSDIDLFACDVGPGSFTGIRIGVNTINAFLISTGKKAVGISSLDMIAYPCMGTERYTAVLIYARNDQVYAALFDQGRLAGDYYAGNIDAFLENAAKKINGRIMFTGDGCRVFKEKIEDRFGYDAVFSKEGYDRADACSLSQIARKSDRRQDHVRPLYLKKTSARKMKK